MNNTNKLFLYDVLSIIEAINQLKYIGFRIKGNFQIIPIKMRMI